MVKCLPECEYSYCILEKEKNISNIRSSKVTDYAALREAFCNTFNFIKLPHGFKTCG